MSSVIGEEGEITVFSWTKQGLLKVKSKALRSGTWYRTLSRVERGIVDLTIRCVEKVRSRILAETVSKIVNKILMTLEEGFMSRAEKVGQRIAQKLSLIAEKWEDEKISAWCFDISFTKFLGVNALNTKINMQMS
jgi:hypothetical protein